MAQSVSIPGGHGAPLVFNVTGATLLAEISTIASTLTNAFNANTLTINDLSAGTTTTNSVHAHTVHPNVAGTTLNLISGANSADTVHPNLFALTTGGEYTNVNVGTPTTVTGSTGGGDTVFGGAAFTYDAVGGGNAVSFLSGDNTYVGSAAGGDTVIAGSGHDTITTGTGATTTYGGTGDAFITLNDTAVGGVGDQAYLSDGGHATVTANGFSDAVTATSEGQTIFGAASVAAGSQLGVFIAQTGTVTGPANDLIVGGAATTTVFDSVGGNTIFGGTGTLFFVGGAAAAPISETIQSGAGGVVTFGETNESLALSSTSTGSIVAVAGGGNETLNGANATGTFVFFGKADTANGGSYNTSVIGGSGTNFFGTGSGTESITGGTGTNLFTLNEGGVGTNITISDFNAGQDSISFGTAADSVSLASGTVSNGNLTLKLNDGTQVTFIGVTSLSGHTIT